ncbi:hypothetical protein E5161_13135 [Cohnella pontilimi]|uniref:Uncharacterized protein n=1 Tax=Cohnella pontilimi TaxID=2564100 RepID=A0A4U0FA11_9BACL|nr:hypothetical protein [Cohnella pontilimi]TJY41358.1 hypothetical protein E5161_13135 [Cohnella pontilimi]
MIQRRIRNKIAFRLLGLGTLLLAACVGWLAHPVKAQAALLDLLPDIKAPVVDVQVPSLKVETPLVEVTTPAIEVSTPQIDGSSPLIEVTPVQIEIGPVQVETPAAEIRLPSEAIPQQPELPKTPPVKEETPDKPVTARSDPIPSASVGISESQPVHAMLPKVPSTLLDKPMESDAVPKRNEPLPQKDHHAVTSRTAPIVNVAKSVPIPSEPLNTRRPANAAAVMAERGAANGGGGSSGAGSPLPAANPGLLTSSVLIQPPSNRKLYYDRSRLSGTNQWSKPPPVEPPRYTLLL